MENISVASHGVKLLALDEYNAQRFKASKHFFVERKFIADC
jgi:hypothetical protein